jgi:hypothetical protein
MIDGSVVAGFIDPCVCRFLMGESKSILPKLDKNVVDDLSCYFGICNDALGLVQSGFCHFSI